MRLYIISIDYFISVEKRVGDLVVMYDDHGKQKRVAQSPEDFAD